MTAEPVYGPEVLGPHHDVDTFDCGVESLDDYLQRRALSDQAAGKSRTYVIVRQERVVGYFSLAASSVEPALASSRAARGQGNQPIPAILIARLAVDRSEQGEHLGEALLVDSLLKSAAASETIGARVVMAHALDEAAKAFYLKYGFEQSPTNDLHVMILLKDVRRTFGIG